MTEMMKAAVGTSSGIVLRNVARPKPDRQEVVVRVEAAGMNRADIGAASRVAASGAAAVIGMEWAGEVVEVGADVSRFSPGDRVMASGRGGYAEYAVSDHLLTTSIGDLDVNHAATIPMAAMTAYDALVINGGLAAGQSVLIHGATSAVGLMTMQIARHLGAAQVIGTSSTAEKRDKLHGFGATHALDSADKVWTSSVLELTDGRGVDLVIDMVAGASVNLLMSVTTVCGRIINVGRLGGRTLEMDLDLHALRRITYTGVTFRTRSIKDVREISRRTNSALSDTLRDGKISLPLDRIFELDEAGEAIEYIKNNQHFGKVVIVPKW